jgi:hypothetical protein
LATAPITRATSAVGWTMSSISSLTARSLPIPSRRWRRGPGALADLAFLADDLREALEFVGDLLVEADDLVEQDGDLAVLSLNAAGLVMAEADGSARFCPASEELDALVEAAASLYAKSPDAVRRTIVAAANPAITAFADAFRLRKD